MSLPPSCANAAEGSATAIITTTIRPDIHFMVASSEANATTKIRLAHRGILSDQVIARRSAQVHQAAYRMLDRRQLDAWDAADPVHARCADLDLHLGVDGAGREPEDADSLADRL